MLKRESKEKLFRIATHDIFFGGAKALCLANRMKDREGHYIVSTVYSRSEIQDNPYSLKECKWCGQSFCQDESESPDFCSEDCAKTY